MNDILNNINSDLELSHNITISDKYTENVTITSKSDNSYFNNLVHCIIENNDLEAKIANDDISMYLKKKVINICNDITPSLLSSLGFHKSLKPIKFQQSLQLSENNTNMLSSILFLREFYKTNFILIHNNIIFDDTIKDYNIQYILYKNEKFRIIDNANTTEYTTVYSNTDILEKDIRGNVYDTILKNISTYKLPELVKIAEEYNISSKGKKKELYDRIYKTLVNS